MFVRQQRGPKEEGSPPNALLAGLARAGFGFGMDASVIAVAIKKALGRRMVSPRKGGLGGHLSLPLGHGPSPGWNDCRVQGLLRVASRAQLS